MKLFFTFGFLHRLYVNCRFAVSYMYVFLCLRLVKLGYCYAPFLSGTDTPGSKSCILRQRPHRCVGSTTGLLQCDRNDRASQELARYL